MADFNPGRNIVRASTIAGGSASDTHQFSGSVVLHNVDLGSPAADSNLQLDANGTIIRTAAGGGGSITVKEVDGTPSVSGVTTINVSNGTLTDDGAGEITLTTGGGGGSPSSPVNSVQFNEAGAFGGDAEFSWTGTTLHVTGTTSLSGTLNLTGTLNITHDDESTPMLVMAGDEAAAQIGKAKVGSDLHSAVDTYAMFAHADQYTTSAHALRQLNTGDTHINSTTTVQFRLSSNPQMAMNSTGLFGFGAGLASAPASIDRLLDVSGTTRLGHDPSDTHQVTGSLSISGAFGIQLSKDGTATINLDSTTDYFVVCTRDGAVTVNLPSASAALPGSMFIIKDGLGTERTVPGKEISVVAPGADVIDGAIGVGGYGSTLQLTNAFEADQFISDGVNTWYSY
jgi:hypothetical protein